jgi:hypothetical protein
MHLRNRGVMVRTVSCDVVFGKGHGEDFDA